MINFICRNKQCNFEDYYEDESPSACPKCGGKWYCLRFCKERREELPFVNVEYRNNPRWSWSLGVNVQDIPKMVKRYPDRQYHPKTGQLLVKNRPHKKKLMREHEMYELS